MEMINQLSDGKAKAFAKHCFESYSPEELNAAAAGSPDKDQADHWGITEGQWQEAVTAALADHKAQSD
ncbi:MULTISPECIES: hypothetical protein [Halomonadaceae]|jgi:hypothetical protein|uniref:Uncharacterized protein n=2 Tax=Halomonadaceae TaxID=28256 RepID=A0A8H9LWS0_9GAMM|nr:MULTISPECIES: hypothetical protein [Halomonas]KHJ51539.1 hypothetical protein PZ78_07315 [Halomonas hydrothermalis]UDM08921.1 hypothetical protein LG409_08495 [Halomonas sp. NyZ770]GGW22519.1 hypothetical protein GCM10007157_11540 [Halomonas hamiltonii]GGW58368.1 hypothetical protein GCM10007158_19220 [Halomonas johnsoniae]